MFASLEQAEKHFSEEELVLIRRMESGEVYIPPKPATGQIKGEASAKSIEILQLEVFHAVCSSGSSGDLSQLHRYYRARKILKSGNWQTPKVILLKQNNKQIINSLGSQRSLI